MAFHRKPFSWDTTQVLNVPTTKIWWFSPKVTVFNLPGKRNTTSLQQHTPGKERVQRDPPWFCTSLKICYRQECSKETPNNEKITQKVDFPGKNGKFQTLKCRVWKTTGANTQAPSCPSASARECHVDLAKFHAG